MHSALTLLSYYCLLKSSCAVILVFSSLRSQNLLVAYFLILFSIAKHFQSTSSGFKFKSFVIDMKKHVITAFASEDSEILF